ncbi:hypothetical protein K3N28_06100 [Glycomyces sp. TRM65418]|uniref:hypothetical protein n=1 Tax=Glycomyces sp. TRM65418 TaxID=2867006 RepID=UPI001CE4E97F|nr:hypothetical protein [Glycomyces sp. TRM65418]MCC3762641.1 hypothetical protein [Glycomyces sp. TRM65418]QZD56678.1 hypothetical protein K3N28_06060 [Glycomyces sp. TRM65418]
MDSRTPQVIEHATNGPSDGLDHLDVPEPDVSSLHADAAKVARFAADGFTGPEFTCWFKELLDTAARVLNAWILSEMVFAKLRGIGIDLEASTSERLALRQQAADRADLVQYAVSEAGRTLIDALRKGEWRPDGRASVQTYFVRRTLYKFPTAFRSWRRRRRADARCVDRLVDSGEQLDGTEFIEKVERDDHFERMLRGAESDTDRAIMILVKEEYSERAVAELLSLQSTKRVRTIKKRMEQADREFEGGHDA